MTYASVEVGSKGLGQRSILLPPKEAIPKARAAALKALQIDDSLAEAHASLGLIAEQYDYDWQTAEREFRRAIELDPDYATGHQWYAEYLSLQGRFDEAMAESERARQLDPLSSKIRGAIETSAGFESGSCLAETGSLHGGRQKRRCDRCP